MQHYGFFTGCPLHPPSEARWPDLRRLSSMFGQGWFGQAKCAVYIGSGQIGELRTFLPAARIRILQCVAPAYLPVRSAETLQRAFVLWLHWSVADAL